MENFTEEANARDKVIMNKIIALERAQKSSYIPKANLFPKNKSKEDRPRSSQIPNTLARTNVVELDSSSEDEESEGEESEDEQTGEKANLVESKISNIFLGGSYTHTPIIKVALKEENEESILNSNSQGVQYSQKEKGKDPSTL